MASCSRAGTASHVVTVPGAAKIGCAGAGPAGALSRVAGSGKTVAFGGPIRAIDGRV